MNWTTSTATSSSNFRLIIDSALDEYTKQTGIDLTQNLNPFAHKIQHSDSPEVVLELFQERANEFKEYRDRNRKLINALKPAVQLLHTFSNILGEVITPAPFPPAKAIFVGIDVLLSAANGVSASYDALEELFECVQNFLERLHVYTEISPTAAMKHILVKLMAELLSVLSLATKQIKQGRFKKFAKKLLGESEVEAVLQRLDRLTHEEARMTIAQTFQVVHGLMSNIRVVMGDGRASISDIRKALIDMQETTSKINKMERDQLQKDVRSWLSPPNPSINHNIACEVHQTGTAAWFLEGSIFSEWKEKGSLLWIHGKPGSGKSILLSAIIEDVSSLRAAGLASMAYYYFDFRDPKKQNCHGLLSSLLIQLSAKSNPCYDVLSRVYAAHDSGVLNPADKTLTQTLRDMLELPGQGPVYIIIDALDECPNNAGMPTPREKVLRLIKELVNLELPNVHICVTSRPEFDIHAVLEPLTSFRVSLHDQSGQKQDILDYVTEVVHTDLTMGSWREQDKQLVITTLSEKADGMFRWVYCQLECLRRTLPASIQVALDELPKTLDETYKYALRSIDEEKREYAQRLFQCLTISIRPLHVVELAEVLAIRFEPDVLPNHDVGWRLSDAEEAVLSVCSSLISVVDMWGSKVVQFSHFSVKEFLTSDHLATLGDDLSCYHVLPGPAHTILAKVCLSILLKLDDRTDKTIAKTLPLARYAARYWVDHAQFGHVSQDIMKGLFDPDKPHFSAWVWVFNTDRPLEQHMSTMHPTRPEAVPLYYAALYGFHGLAEHLVLAHPSQVNARGGYHTSPLRAALFTQNMEIAELLLQHGAEVDVRDDQGQTFLHLALRLGRNADFVRLLLENNADVNAPTREGRTPLHLATMAGQLEISNMLLQRSAIVDCRGVKGWTPLHYVARYGHADIMMLLLDRDVDVNVQTEDGQTPLHVASYDGHSEIIKTLVQRGAAVNIRDHDDDTSLHHAAWNGHLDIAQFLIDNGTNIDVRNGNGETALFLASGNGKLGVVRFLIDQGADLNSRSMRNWVPLHFAARYGHLDVVQLLLDHGADPNVQNDDRSTPLHLASANGHIKVSQLLVDSGASVDSRNNLQDTPLIQAAGNGKINLVHFLLKSGANVHARNRNGWTALHCTASWGGHLKIVKLLLSRGADIDSRNQADKTAADLASDLNQTKIASFLAEYKGDENVRNKICSTTLDVILQDADVDEDYGKT